MKRTDLILWSTILFFCFLFACGDSATENSTEAKTESAYLGLNDTVHYVGMHECRKCHESIYNSFIRTGMGQSFDTATRVKSAADFGPTMKIYDPHSDLSYFSFWKDHEMFIREYRLSGKDTVHSRTELVSYIIGSGQHTNSHISNTNGYLHQMPMTFYTQKRTWDLPPGFENGFNTRFSRKIGLECMTCHNSLPQFVQGSENKYKAVPDGIGCERCHGPGQAHVEQKRRGEMIDTSRYVDFSIVNPGKLTVDLQFDVCQRCHLQGNAVLKENKSFFDFKPGMKLSEVMTVFVPRHKGDEDEFIMASHADRLKMSPCFKKTFKPDESSGGSLRPYKQSMTCVTCHNPHVSVKETGTEIFNKACRNCHEPEGKIKCSEDLSFRIKKNGDNCFSCHMPKSGTIDIPHVSTTDHYIRKPVTEKKKKELKEFLGLYAVNEKNPDRISKAKAYINQFEKFEAKAFLLDSAERYLRSGSREELFSDFTLLIHHSYLKGNTKQIIQFVNKMGKETILKVICVKRSWDNSHAWTLYRISEAYTEKGDIRNASDFLSAASILAPYNLDFLIKLGSLKVQQQDIKGARVLFEKVINENPEIPSPYVNIGYLDLIEGSPEKAEKNYRKALSLDPDHTQGLMNMAGLCIFRKDFPQAKIYLKRILKKDPENRQAMTVLKSIGNGG